MSKQQPPHIKHTLNQSKSKTAFSFAKQNRFLPEKSYSPNKFYDLPSTLSRRGSSIGIGSKTNFSRLEFVEPGRYQLSSDFQKKEKTPRFTTFGINRQEFYKGKSSCNLVGPGAYSPAQLASSRSIYIASRPSAHNPKHNISAATYDVRDETWNRLSTYQNSDKSCRIKTQYYPKDILHPYNNKTPGPGAYNPNPPAPNRNRTLNIGKQYLPKPQKPSKVGPGSQYILLTKQPFFPIRHPPFLNLFSPLIAYLKYITNMYENQDQEEVKDPDADLPPYRIRHNDMKLQNVKLIVRKTTEFIKEERKKPEPMLEKDVCLRLVEYLKSNKADFGAGEGEWQCIIGKNLAATLNYDLHQLTFFDLTDFGYSILVFKSG